MPDPTRPLEWAVLLFCTATLPGLLWLLREDCAHEIYIVWYVCWLTFVIFSVLHIVAAWNDVEFEHVFGETASTTFRVVLKYLSDFNGEISALAIGLGLVVVPQFLTYTLSALTGSASPPVLIESATRIANWSFVKFCAAFGGILLSEGVSDWILHSSVRFSIFLKAGFMIWVAFGYLVVSLLITIATGSFRTNRFGLGRLRSLHEWSTRFRDMKLPFDVALLKGAELVRTIESDAPTIDEPMPSVDGELWLIDQALRDIATKLKLSPKNPRWIIGQLLKRGLVNKSTRDLYLVLYAAWSEAYDTGTSPNEHQATEYARQAEFLQKTLLDLGEAIERRVQDAGDCPSPMRPY